MSNENEVVFVETRVAAITTKLLEIGATTTSNASEAWTVLRATWEGVTFKEANADAREIRDRLKKGLDLAATSVASYVSNALRCVKAGNFPETFGQALKAFSDGTIPPMNGAKRKPKAGGKAEKPEGAKAPEAKTEGEGGEGEGEGAETPRGLFIAEVMARIDRLIELNQWHGDDLLGWLDTEIAADTARIMLEADAAEGTDEIETDAEPMLQTGTGE